MTREERLDLLRSGVRLRVGRNACLNKYLRLGQICRFGRQIRIANSRLRCGLVRELRLCQVDCVRELILTTADDSLSPSQYLHGIRKCSNGCFGTRLIRNINRTLVPDWAPDTTVPCVDESPIPQRQAWNLPSLASEVTLFTLARMLAAYVALFGPISVPANADRLYARQT